MNIIIDERQTQKKKETKTKKDKRTMGDRSYSERVRAKWFYWTIKLGFLHLICKASLIVK